LRPAIGILCYAVVLAWVLPLPLARLSRTGVSPRLGLAAWLAAMVSVLACTVAALWLLVRAAVAGWPEFARTVCESVTTTTCPPSVYRSVAYEAGLALTAITGGIVMTLLCWRYARSLRRARIRTRAHGEAARITGRPAMRDTGAFVLDATQPAIYCVPGRPPTIVLTTGALAVLEPEQVTAVLAHEHAHLAARHHLLLAITRSLAAVAPAVPVFARGTGEVARLAEMRADDVAVRRCDRHTLLTALLAMGAVATRVPGAVTAVAPVVALTPAAGPVAAQGPASWLAATGGVVAARVLRLSDPPPRARRVRYALALATLTLATAVASALVPALAVTLN
jgi:Zn-dependent protease with chaperone function